MILWLLLFLLVLAISFILAFQSMRDYHEIPQKTDWEYGLFLIKNSAAFSSELLDILYQQINKEGLLISVERLFKGKESAFCLFGPKKILETYTESLDLLELEDYTNIDKEQISAWEVGIGQVLENGQKVFGNLPQLLESEQYWWQITIGKSFTSQIRAVLFSKDLQRREELAKAFQNLSNNFVKLPSPYSVGQIFEFFKQRSLVKDSAILVLNSKQIIQLSKI